MGEPFLSHEWSTVEPVQVIILAQFFDTIYGIYSAAALYTVEWFEFSSGVHHSQAGFRRLAQGVQRKLCMHVLGEILKTKAYVTN